MDNGTYLQAAPANQHKSPHPFIFLIFYLPYGIFSGYLNITLAYLFSKSGVSIQQIAGLAAINLIPQVFKFVWAPLVDTTLSLKKWYLFSTLTTAICIFATGIVPLRAANLPLFTFMILLSSFARSFISAAINGLAAHNTLDEVKGRAGGYGQAGALGGGALGGGIGLWLAQHTGATWVPGTALALFCVLCCAALFFINEPVSTIRVKGIRKTANNVVTDVWQTIKAKRGLLALILCLIPAGTGAAGYLFAAIAADWKVNADTIAWVTGIIGGLVTMAGSLSGGWICDKMDRQLAYVLFGVLQGMAALGLAFCPHIPSMYITWTLAYTFTNGLSYAAFNAYALEATGNGAAASKFELFAGASWVPIYTMTWVAGFAYSKWAASGMLKTEAVCAILGAALFMGIKAMVKRQKVVLKSVPV